MANAKNEKGRGTAPAKADDSNVVPAQADSDTELMRRLEMLGGSQTSIGGGVRTIGESELGPVRASTLGTYSRVVMVAIDASPTAKYAFQCESNQHPPSQHSPRREH